MKNTKKRLTLSVKKTPVKSEQFFSCDQHFFPTNNFTGLKLKTTKSFYQLVFLLNKNKITKILKKLSDLLYHNLVERSGVGLTTKKAVMKKKLQFPLKLISQNQSVTQQLISQN